MTEKNNQRDNNNIAQSIYIKNKNQRNNNTNNNEGVLNKSKYEITINDEGDIVNSISEVSPKKRLQTSNSSGTRSGDQYERSVSRERGEIKSPSGSRSGDHNDEHGTPQKVKGCSESKLPGSRSGDQCEGTDNQMMCAKDHLSGSRSGDLSEGKAKPKDGCGENFSGTRSGDQYEGLAPRERGEIKGPSGSRNGGHNGGHGIPQKVKGYSESKLSDSRSGDQNEGTDNQMTCGKDYISGPRSGDLSEGRAKPREGCGEFRLSSYKGGILNGGQGNEGDHSGGPRSETQHNEKHKGKEADDIHSSVPEKEKRQVTEENNIEGEKEGPKWQISKEKIAYVEEKHWMSQNVQLNTVMGRNWLRRTTEEGIIIRDCFRLSTGGKEEVSIDQNKIIKIIEGAAMKGGIELKIVRGEGIRQEERTLNTGATDSMKLVYFQESSTIKIKRKIIPEGAGKISYKEIVETRSERRQGENQEDQEDRQTVTINEDDNQRLCWVLKMHTEKRMNKNPDMSHSPTDLEWARRKFEAIGKKGKSELLIYLAYKTGSELRIIEKGRGRGGIRVIAKNLEFAITYNLQTGTIEISWENVRGKQSSGNTERQHSVMKSGGSSQIKGKIMDGKDTCKAHSITAGGSPGSAPNNDVDSRIMDGSDKVNEMRAVSYRCMKGTYPPEEVKQFFEHVRQSLHICKSANPVAGEGLMVKKKRGFVKGEIIGAYEGIIVEEREGPYVLKITRDGAPDIWVDADPKQGDRVSIFGKMNMDLHEDKYNAEMGEDGFIKILVDCEEEELFTKYYDNYNWDELKQKVLTSLKEELESKFPCHSDLIPTRWTSLKAGHDHISRWIKRMIEGNLASSEKHGINGWNVNSEEQTTDDLMCFLTFGPTCTKYNFKHWGQDLPTPEIHQFKRASTSQYAEMWENGGIIMGKVHMIKDIDKGNPEVSQLMGRVKVARKAVRKPITKEPSIVSVSGRIKISLRFTERRRSNYLRIINDCKTREQLRIALKSMDIWKVVFKQQPKEEDRILGNGWCGYVSMNQIRRGADLATNIAQEGGQALAKQSVTQEGVASVLETVQDIYNSSTGSVRVNWESLSSARLKGREILLSVMDTLRNWEHRLVDSLELARWLNAQNLYGTCNKWKYSHWGEDPEDQNYCDLRDSPGSTGPRVGMVSHHSEWEWIVKNVMLVGRNNHYYVRKGDLEEDFRIAFDWILERVIDLIGEQLRLPEAGPTTTLDPPADNITTLEDEPSETIDIPMHSLPIASCLPSSLENGSKIVGTLGSNLATSCIPFSLEEGLKKDGEQAHPHKGIGAKMTGPFEILTEDPIDGLILNDDQDDTIIIVEAAPKKRKSGHNKKEPICDPGEDKSGPNNKLKVIFWNSNGWNRERCEKIATEAEKTDADILCLTDTRMDPVRDNQMKTYEKMMDRITGKKWKGRIVNRPGYTRGCLVGGSILLTSHNCSNVRRKSLIDYGVMDRTELTWRANKLSVISTYRPYENKAKGSLRSALSKGTDDFEEDYWEALRGSVGAGAILIGGDFNLERSDLDQRIEGMGINRIELQEGEYTFKAEIGDEGGRVIDHILQKGLETGARTSQSPEFLRDHIPMIVEVTLNGAPHREGRRLKQIVIPTIRPGDAGAKRRIKKEMETHLCGKLEDWSLNQITNWTANRAKEIAKKRNKKDNPDGWSPLARLMRLKVKILGAVFKRMERKLDIQVCYRLFKEVKTDIAAIDLSEDELTWMDENGVTGNLPDWAVFKARTKKEELAKEVKTLNKLSSSKMRRELRLKHDDWTRKIQEAADKGKIGAVLRSIMKEDKDFSLEVLYGEGEEENKTDADEIADIVTKHFGRQFDLTAEEDANDLTLSDLSSKGDKAGFVKMSTEQGIPEDVAERVFGGLTAKYLPEEAETDVRDLGAYTPTYDEFLQSISRLDPKSAGGPSGLTYLLVQYWPQNVKERVYEVIKTSWVGKLPMKEWGDKLLQIIPKIKGAGLKDLRPLMLVEVMRKVWVGIVMKKIARFWEKWGLIDKSQHAYLRGKGTHTVLPQLLNCLEAARDYKTDIYISSFDMKQAFDSVCRRFLLWCLVRLKIPKELAEYLISLDAEGEVYVKCPKNLNILERGIEALRNEGYRFKARKGVGQGDLPSPLFWVAVLDTLLTALRNFPSEFKIQDLEGRTHPAEDLGYADDLQSIEASHRALQDKANMVSAWCIYTGIQISHTKMRTFGTHWGVHKGGNPELLIYTKGWKPIKVEMKMDGTMKSLGVKFDMHVDNQVQKRDCIGTIKEKGEKINQADARRRDKLLALSYILLTNVVYRSQHCPWHLEEYHEVESAYIKQVKRAVKLIPGYPTRLIIMNRRDGGLGVTSTITAAMERKRKNLLDLAHRPGAMGLAMQSQLSRMMRDAGRGGIGPCRIHLWPALGDQATGLSALIVWLKTIRLRVRIGWATMEGWELACTIESDREQRISLNKRGIVLKGELGEDGEVPIRVGQCWELDNKVYDILGYNENRIEVMEWESAEKIEKGCLMRVTDKDVIASLPGSNGRPTGMGGRNTIDRDDLIERASHLIELSVDKVTRGGEGTLTSVVMERKKKKAMERVTVAPRYLSKEWATFGPPKFSHIYTDGSFRKLANWGETLLNTPRHEAGGAIVLSDGKSWFYKIFVEIDIKVKNAAQVELLCLLIAEEIAKVRDNEIILGSDCQSGLDVIEGAYSEGFSNTTSGWKKWDGTTTVKIKAHPERYKEWGTWEFKDMGIYVADAVAGGEAIPHAKISAKEWLTRISAQSIVAIEEEDGTPFIGSVSQRASEECSRHYLMERDGYREIEGEWDPKWDGANLSMAPTLLRRNGGLEDRVTMSKLAAGKRWDVSKHNPAKCVLCEEEFESQRHPMMGCIGYEVHECRQQWQSEIKERKNKESQLIRIEMDEFHRNVFKEEDGELAAVGTFTPRWVDKLNKNREFNLNEAKAMKRLMTTIAQGARAVMRVYTRACQDKNRDKDNDKINRAVEKIAELRQVGMLTFLGPSEAEGTQGKPKKGKKKPSPKTGCFPPREIRNRIEQGRVGLLHWEE